MLPSNGKIPRQAGGAGAADDEEEQLPLEHTYEAEPQPITGMAPSQNAPFTTGRGFIPKLKGDEIRTPSGKQPVFHLKVTARPLKNLQREEPLSYRMRAGPTNEQEYREQRVGKEGVVHCLPREKRLGFGEDESTRTGGPTTEGGLLTSEHRSSSYLDQLSNLSGITHDKVGALVHAYRGQQAIGTDAVMSGLLSAVNTVKVDQPVISETLASQSMDRMDREDAANKQQDFQDLTQINYQRQETERSEQPRLVGEGPGTTRMTGGAATGFGKVIPGLVHPADESRPTVYNWIVPDETSVKEMQRLRSDFTKSGSLDDNSDYFQRGNTGKLFNLMEHTRGETERKDAPAPLFFQKSEQLSEFLNEAQEGMMWEAPQGGSRSSGSTTRNWFRALCCDETSVISEGDVGSLEDVPVKPSVVYGGVQHVPPRVVGELSPLTMRLHATETHQYVPVAGMPHPWFLREGLNPACQAIHGPVALPWDPKFTGMPAPTFQTLKEHGLAAVKLPTQVTNMFDPQLPGAEP